MRKSDTRLLIGEIRESLEALDKIGATYDRYVVEFSDPQRRDARNAIVLSEVLTTTYTCLETIFFRISRLFENHLEDERWHKELLHKMRIEIPGVRKAVISGESFQFLDELRRFRHFRRYYYAMDYDWKRLEFLRSVYEQLRPAIRNELDQYMIFLNTLSSGAEEETTT